MQKRNLSCYAAVFLVLIFIFSLAGCQQQSKKPIPAPMPSKKPLTLKKEVTKYSSEPSFSIYRTATGAKENIKLEEYLKGVVAAEVGPKYPLEAMKAQAIVARTMTLALINYENGTRGKHQTDMSDSHTEFQEYDQTKITPMISRAVDETRGQVLLYNGKFVYALFHSSSKDKTASIEEGFPKLKNKAGYLVPVATHGIKYAPAKYRNWTVKIPRSEIQNIMGSKAGTLNDIRVSTRGPSGRAKTITAGKATISAVDLRAKIGPDRLYSTVISSVKTEGNNIVFRGSGWGHGVGMEQWGAYAMAKEGKNAQAIIKHYFPKAQLHDMY
ncbi:SpoIID/LytB domain-containing protein [Syntrophomonas palmitatica]|uniref:SpoIID/LytB domain-containing protein n=1 Tax=Syntrophomonas palmitatica TaxID=402877 RepID=UPI0006D0A2CA|nr:SpoIID/LytB domain-containing protein [Syntrophomonas palmitatica]